MAKSTTAPLPMSQPTMFEDSSSVIGSPALGDGVTPCALPDGLTSEPSGPAVARVSRSRPADRGLAPTIRAIFGLRGSASSMSAALQRSLVNRLRASQALRGSIVFTLTWKERTTPSGRVISLLRASARRTAASGYGSWPTPLVNDTNGSGYAYGSPTNRDMISLKLCGAVKLAAWPTVKSADADRGGDPRRFRGEQSQNGRRSNLVDAVCLASWNTPTADEAGGTPDDMVARKKRHQQKGVVLGASVTALNLQVQLVSGKTLSGFRAAMASPGQLREGHSRWLQGYPGSWEVSSPGYQDRKRLINALVCETAPCSCGVTVMQSFPKSPKCSLKRT